MNNYFGQNYPSGYPPSNPSPYSTPYPPAGGAPYPSIGFGEMPQPTFFTPQGHPPPPTSSSSYYPNQQPNWGDSGGFPIAGPSQGYPQAPGYPPSGPTYPPTYPSSSAYPPPSQPTYPSSQPSYPPPQNSPYQNSTNYNQPTYPGESSSGSLYPNLNGYGAGSTQTHTYPQPPPPTSPYGPTPTTQPYHPPMNPTVRPQMPFNPQDDAGRLYKAMKGFGTDEATLIDVLCHRPSSQRQQISLAFKSSYGKDLVRNLESETSGDFRDVLVALARPVAVYEAECLRNSIAGIGTNETILIDIICTKSNAEMIELRNVYRQLYSHNMEDDVRDDVSGYFKRFLVSLMAANRQENQPADYNRAVQLARELYEAGERRLGTNEMVFNRIFATESFAQLRLVFDEYQKLTRHPIENAVRSEMSSSVEQAYLTLIQYVRSPAGFYAQRLHDSMRGMGTRDKHLIRICVLRCEIDMQDIKIEFQRRFGQPLESWIRSDCSGDYRRALLCLVGDPRWKS